MSPPLCTEGKHNNLLHMNYLTPQIHICELKMLGIELFDVCCVCEYLCDVWVKRNLNTNVEYGFVFHKRISCCIC